MAKGDFPRAWRKRKDLTRKEFAAMWNSLTPEQKKTFLTEEEEAVAVG